MTRLENKKHNLSFKRKVTLRMVIINDEFSLRTWTAMSYGRIKNQASCRVLYEILKYDTAAYVSLYFLRTLWKSITFQE